MPKSFPNVEESVLSLFVDSYSNVTMICTFVERAFVLCLTPMM